MSQEVVRVVRLVEALPDEFAAILVEAAAEGVRNMAMLATEVGSAADPYRDPGALFAAFVGGDLAGVGGVTVERSLAEPAMRMRRLYVRPGFRRTGVARALAGDDAAGVSVRTAADPQRPGLGGGPALLGGHGV